MAEDKDNLDNLYPEERIKRLKELEQKRKKEIEEAQKKIKESEEELRERLKWKERVPIPEFAQEELRGLSEDAKEILQRHRGIKKIIEKPEEDILLSKKKLSLEEAVNVENLKNIPPEILEADYTQHLSRKPVQSLYQEMADIQKEVEEKGYISREEERRVEYMMGAMERKREEGYNFSEEVARKANVTQQIGANLRSVYKSSQRDVYHAE